VGDKVYSHNSNCIYSVAKSNGDSIEFSLSIAEQRAVGFIPAWSLAFLHCRLCWFSSDWPVGGNNLIFLDILLHSWVASFWW